MTTPVMTTEVPMTTTTETNRASDDGDLFTVLRRMFGEPAEPEQYEYLRIPGLHLAAELEEVIEPEADYVVWQSGRFHDGRMLLTVYCRRRKEAEAAPPALAETHAESADRGTTAQAHAAPTKVGSRKRGR